MSKLTISAVAVSFVFISAIQSSQAMDIVDGSDKGLPEAYLVALKSALANEMKDPDSVKIRGMTSNIKDQLCGQLMAKNSYGGYGGFHSFYFTVKGGSITIPDSLESHYYRDSYKSMWPNLCGQPFK